MTALNRWGAPKRTRADRERDCLTFCATARIEAVRGISIDGLVARYGVQRQFAEYHQHMRIQRERHDG